MELYSFLLLLSTLSSAISLFCSHEDSYDAEVNNGFLRFRRLSLNEAACFTLFEDGKEKGNFAISLDRLTGIAAFSERYEFGIPVVNSSCACICGNDCSGGSKKLEYCKGYDSNGIPDLCIAPIKKDQVNLNDCTLKAAIGCCEITIRQDQVDGPYTAFQVRSYVEHYVDILFFQDYNSLINGKVNTFKVNDDNVLPVSEPDTRKYFKSVLLKSNIYSRELDDNTWYIKDEDEVYTSSFAINSHSHRNLKKVGWLRYNDKQYELDGVTQDEIKNLFEVEFEKCDETGLKSAQLDTPRQEDFKKSLKNVAKNNKNVKSMKVLSDGSTGTHGSIQYDYNTGIDDLTMEIQLKVRTSNSGKLEIKKHYVKSSLGEFTAELVMTESGERYIRLKLTGSSGLIYGVYKLNTDAEETSFSFDCLADPFVQYISSNVLECKANARPEICLFTDYDDQDPTCQRMPCTEVELPPDEHIEGVIDVTVKDVLDPMNWRSWVKVANPMEWFNGINSYQEAVMMALELVGVVAGIGMLLKVLKMLNLLGKCCRFMWCCCFCPKFEKKVKSKTRRMTKSLKRRYTKHSVRFSETVHTHRVRTETALERSLQNFRKSVLKKVFDRHLSQDTLNEHQSEEEREAKAYNDKKTCTTV